MRVLHVIDSLGNGGAERVLVGICRELTRSGVDVRVLALQSRQGNPVASDITALGVAVTALNVAHLRDIGGFRATCRAMSAAHPDIVHTHLEFSNVLGTLAAVRLGVPSVATLHTLDAPPRFSRAWLRYKAMACVLRSCAQRVVAVSESTRAHHVDRGGLPPACLVVIPNGTEIASTSRPTLPPRETIRDELAIPHDAPLITTVALHRPGKGLDVMIDALRAVQARHPNAVYLLVGDGPDRAALERRVCQRGLSGAVRFAGMRSDVAAVLADSDLFVQPSLVDAWPTTVMEALAAGLPVIGTRVGGIAEMIEDGRTGLLVPPADSAALAAAVIGLLDDPAAAGALGAEARRAAAQRFDVTQAVSRLLAEYRVVLGRC